MHFPSCFSPSRCFAYNAKEIRIGRIPSGVVGKPVEFESKCLEVAERLVEQITFYLIFFLFWSF